MAGLSDRVAVVTGAAQGIGAATAVRLATDGARVAVLDLDADRTAGTVEAVTAAGGTALGLGCDVSDEASVAAAFAQVAADLGPVGVLVNNAGVTRDNLLFKMTVEDWDTVAGIHLRGSFLCARAAQEAMVAARWGKIVNLSSTSALGNRGQANYAAAKAGLQGLTKALAIELGPFNINVNAVAPGFVETAMTRQTAARIGVDYEQMKRGAVERTPLRRTGRPQDIANVVAVLCSEDTAFVTGQVIYAAGGPRG